MKTTLPESSLFIKERLDNIVKEILAIAEDKIAMIILFGSYARGTWVQDAYREDHIVYSYSSDLDIMLVLRKARHNGYTASKMEHDIIRRLENRGLAWPPMTLPTSPSVEEVREHIKIPSISLIVEPITRVNKELEKKQYFFTDIKKEGILLYDNGEFQLAEAKDLPWEEKKQMASDYYDYWFDSGSGFLIDTNHALQREDFRKSAFYLHQATESFYNAILLVFAEYKGKDHDILKLGMKARSYQPELFKVFPCAAPEQLKCFKLLRKAYIDARYDKNYKISKEQLLYLIERVELLRDMTRDICFEYINGGGGGLTLREK